MCMQTKICTKCNIEKCLTEFSYSNKQKNTYQYRCKKCKAEDAKLKGCRQIFICKIHGNVNQSIGTKSCKLCNQEKILSRKKENAIKKKLRFKYKVICEFHGESINQRYSTNYNKCKMCLFEIKLTEEFKNKYENFSYIKTPLFTKDNRTPITICCKIHGEYNQTLVNIRKSKSMACLKCVLDLRSKIMTKSIFNEKDEKLCSICKNYKLINLFPKQSTRCTNCITKSSSTLKAKEKYKKTDKFILNAIKYNNIKTDLNYYNCDNCDILFINKNKLRHKFKFCKNCNNKINKRLFGAKNALPKQKQQIKICIDCENEYIGFGSSLRCEICRDIRSIIVRQNYYKTEQYKITRKKSCGDHRHRAKNFKVPYVKFDKWNEVYKRDNFICQYCGIVCDTNKINKNKKNYITIDCIIPMSKGGAYEPSNCVTACRSCNSKKGDKLNILPNKFPYKSKQLPLF